MFSAASTFQRPLILYNIQVHVMEFVDLEFHALYEADHAATCSSEPRCPRECMRLPTNQCYTATMAARLRHITVLAMLNCLGAKSSYSRPRVSDDNAFVESLFKTATYRPEFFVGTFDDRNEA